MYHTYHRGGTHYWPIWLDWWHRGRIVCKGSETASRWDPVKGEENQSERHKCVRIRIKSSKGWWMSYLNLMPYLPEKRRASPLLFWIYVICRQNWCQSKSDYSRVLKSLCVLFRTFVISKEKRPNCLSLLK